MEFYNNWGIFIEAHPYFAPIIIVALAIVIGLLDDLIILGGKNARTMRHTRVHRKGD